MKTYIKYLQLSLLAAVFAVVFLSFSSQTNASTLTLGSSITGQNAGDNFSEWENEIADINADGKDDLIVASQSYDSYTGRVYIFFNNSSYPAGAGSADVVIDGDNQDFGQAMTTGDVNADGKIDLIVAAGYYEGMVGRVYIFYNDGTVNFGNTACSGSSPTVCLAATADATITGVGDWDDFGFDVATGDVNNDGKTDLVVAADGYNDNGGIFLYYNDGNGIYPSSSTGADVIISGTASYVGLGAALAVGNIDSNPGDDIIAGTWSNKALIFYQDGSHWGTTACTTDCSATNADVIMTGENSGDYLGSSSIISADLNNDTKDDLIIGCSGYDVGSDTGEGRVYVFYNDGSYPTAAGSADLKITGQSGTSFGVMLASGDLDKDSKDDLVVAGTGYSTNTGRVYILYQEGGWPTLAADADQLIDGEAINNMFGLAMDIGDIDNDYDNDLMIGSRGYSSSTGRIYLYYQPGAGSPPSSPANEGVPTTLLIDNVPPSFTAGPSDGPSSGTAPTNAGANVTFTATAHDNNADQYYLAICKNGNAPTAGTDGPPTCNGGAGNNWAISAATNSDAPASVTYTTSAGNAESNDWWAFVCDKNTSGLCSALSQGTGDAGSPFKVNHKPSIANIKIGSQCGDTAPTAPGNAKTMKITNGVWSGSDMAFSSAIQSDGKIITTGSSNNGTNNDFAVARYNSNGVLDTSFGNGGKVTTLIGSSNETAYSVKIQSDGKIVAAGNSNNGSNDDFALVRYNPDGSLDTDFGTGGKVTTAIGSGIDRIRSLIIQNDGKIVTAGYSHNGSNFDFTLARYNSDGTPDNSFDTDGIVTTPIGSGDDVIVSAVIQIDGKIIASGYSHNGSNADFALVRYNPNGSLDTDFGTGGKVTTSMSSGNDYGNSVAIQLDGKIVVGGYGNYDFAVARFNSNGSLDSDFGTGGKVITDIRTSQDYINSMVITPDGKIVVGGTSSNGTNYDFALVRYNSDGSLDTNFDTDGKVTTAMSSATNLINSLSLQPDGKINAIGYADLGSNYDFALSRYNTNGSLDATFDYDGKVTTAIGSNDDFWEWGQAIAIQGDGKMVVAGTGDNGVKAVFAVMRYNTDGSFDATFDSDGKITTEIGTAGSYASSVAIQSDGKIIVAGGSYNGSNYDFAVVRYNTDGSLDTSFDTDGKVMTAMGSGPSSGASVAIQNDGKILVAGYATNGNIDFAVARYNADGSLDTGFGTGGKVYTNAGGYFDDSRFIAIQNDGKILVTGLSLHETNAYLFSIVRYNDDGSLDTSFDTDGMVTTDVSGGDDYSYSIALQTDNKIVVGGSSGGAFAVVRYNADGTLDTSFDTDGKVTTSVGSDDGASWVGIQTDGKIVATGSSDNTFAAVRYNSNGTLDTSFNTDGMTTTAFGSGDSWSYSGALQSDGKIVLVGEYDYDTNGVFAIVRYETDGDVDTTSNSVCIQGDIADTDADTTADTVEMHVCSTDSFSGGVCGGTTLCKITGVRNGGKAQCIAESQVTVPMAHGDYSLYVFTVDSHGMQGTDTSTQSYTVADVSPELVSYTATDAPGPSAGGSDTVNYSVSLKDANGDNDVTNVKGVFFNPDAVTRHCASAENDCYIHSSCTLTGVNAGADENLGADCTATVWFNSDAGDWDVEAQATDGMGELFFDDAGVSLTNPALQGIDISEGTIAYGTIVIGGTSAGQTTSMGNVGNQELDVYVSGTAMTAGSYNISVGQQKWQHESATFDWDDPAAGAGPYSMVGTPSGTGDAGGCLNRNILVRTVHGTGDTNESIFWKLRIPAGQQAGSYTGQNTFQTTSGGTCSTGAGF